MLLYLIIYNNFIIFIILKKVFYFYFERSLESLLFPPENHLPSLEHSSQLNLKLFKMRYFP